MKKKMVMLFVGIFVVVSIFVVLLVGQYGSSSIFPDNTPTIFDAEVLEVHPDYLLVQGLENNDLNHRGTFTIPRNSLVPGSELADSISQGSRVQITYAGIVTETYPAHIYEVISIHFIE